MKIVQQIFLFSILSLAITTNCRLAFAGVQKSVFLPSSPKGYRADTLIKGRFNSASGLHFDSTAINTFLMKKPLFKDFEFDLKDFYKKNNYSYVWYQGTGLIEFAHALVSAITNVEQDGVTFNIPYKNDFDKLSNDTENDNNLVITMRQVETELMLTAQYFYYARKVWAGSTEVSDWHIPRRKLSYELLLTENINSNTIDSKQNALVRAQYAGLKDALSFYRPLEANESSINIAGVKNSVSRYKHTNAATIIAVKKRLSELGYRMHAPADSLFTTEFAASINLFKANHGLKQDSVIDNNTIRELNVPIRKRIEQIIVNMERLRWMPSNRQSPEFLFVNIPEYRLHLYESEKETWACNVVVGKPMSKTVIFSGEIQYIIFSPFWYLPASIIRKEVIPGMKRNANYLNAHNMEWNNGNVRQKPGPNNSLGLVKFIFPNANNIYLHDTPAKSLFNEDQRAFSHGCVRVGLPLQLATLLLKRDRAWTEKNISLAMNKGIERTVTLDQKMPVYIGYLTAFIDKSGNLNFRDDVYKRDDLLFSLLRKE